MRTKKVLGTALTSIGFVVGFAALTSAQGGSIDTTGPDSQNEISNTSSHKLKVWNNNNIQVTNDNDQYASTGDATATHNTSAGDAETGSASNANSSSVSATVNNSASMPALMNGANNGNNSSNSSIENTGPDSTNLVTNTVTSKVSVTNDNFLFVDNVNHQTATSGVAVVSGNTTGGSATSGDAENRNTTSSTFNVTN